ncbi:MAG: hypothetical protein HKP58_05150, partial [Desulfatitalea sp.]|nr:hypothetical protein [Desulfatitalea sp.]NNJ99780.1 hypothetical protein [Desulfatitalea sp.]
DLDGGLGSPSPWQPAPKAPVKAEDSVLIVENDAAERVHAAFIEKIVDGRLALHHQGATGWLGFKAGDARLKSSPRFRRNPWINGPSVRRAKMPHGLADGSIIAWRKTSGQDKKWKFAEVERADAFGVALKPHKEPFRLPDGENGVYQYDDIWPLFNDYSGTIEVRRAVKLENSFTIPSKTVAEKAIGLVEEFAANKMFSSFIPKTEEGSMPNLTFSEDLIRPVLPEGQSDNLDSFIKWLFGAISIAAGFPISPDMLVNIGAMIKTKDARIPSTGQLVFEAFLDLFGKNGRDEGWPETRTPSLSGPPLFRYWVEENATTSGAATSERIPFGKGTGELWYIPVKPDGAGKIDTELGETIVLYNRPDGNRFFFNGKPNGVKVGDWAAAKFDDDKWCPVKIKEIEEPAAGYEQRHAPSFALRLDMTHAPLSDDAPEEKPEAESAYAELVELQADYRGESRPAGADANDAAVDAIEISPEPSAGQPLLAFNGDDKAQLVTVNKEAGKLTLSPKLGKDFTQGNLKLYGNIVPAGHGERQPSALMGSGAGADRKESLILERTEVATIPDSRLARGAREDIAVRIQDELWHAVSHLDESGPADRHYTLSTTQEGHLKLRFGDGRHGRALPPGANNVTVAYRVGAGRNGCVPPNALDRLVHPHPLVASIRQPFKAKGGQDMERREEMRDNASASLLALERCVSVSDFEQLANQHRAIIKARAFYTIGGAGRFDRVTVVAVMTEGDEIDTILQKELCDYLQRRAVPTVRVAVAKHESKEVKLKIDIRVDSGRYEADKVQAAVKTALAETFGVVKRRIGEPLYLSEVYAAVEAVVGVEDCVCRFQQDYVDAQVVGAEPRQIWFVADEAAIECRQPTEYQP